MQREDEIRVMAYKLWEDEGRPFGRGLEHWFKAEAILSQRSGSHAGATSPGPTDQGKERKRRSLSNRVLKARAVNPGRSKR